MVLNSLVFLFFFIIVFVVYYLPIIKKNKSFQNLWLLLCSYFFYGYANIQMAGLLLISTCVTYALGNQLKKYIDSERWTAASRTCSLGVVLGVGLLLYFKYLNFFIESVEDFLSILGFQLSWSTLNIIVPIGVSFFTFKLIGYILDIYQEETAPAKNFLDFALFISFFPTILSGPIDRPKPFLSQLSQSRSPMFENLRCGLERFVWGWFIKVCIADRIAFYTDPIMKSFDVMNGTSLAIVALIAPIQLYADFNGYSNMAIGISQMLGLKVNENFRRPFFAQNIADFWRRWHMSLTTWITDYVFMPLNMLFRKHGKWGVAMAISLNLIVIGLWHGANWTYVSFGIFHALLFLPLVFSGKMNTDIEFKWIHGWIIPAKNLFNIICTYLLVSIGIIIFNANSVTDAFLYIQRMFTTYGMPDLTDKMNIFIFLIFSLILFVRDYQEECKCKHVILKSNNLFWSNLSLIALISLIILFRGDAPKAFVYIQF